MQYTEEDLKVGTKLRCTDAKGCSHWTTGKVYTVKYGTMNNFVECDNGAEIRVSGMLRRLNKKAINSAEFEIIKVEEQMQYTENDIKEGTKLRCTNNQGNYWWTKGRIYTVENWCIIDNEGDTYCRKYILDSLNGNDNWRAKFEIIEYPTATITVDVEQRLNDKIEALGSERENILAKMDRMEKQQLKLRDKVLKLNEAKKALEILKELK